MHHSGELGRWYFRDLVARWKLSSQMGCARRNELWGFLLGTRYPGHWYQDLKPKPWKSRLRFSLLAPLVLIAVVALGLALVARTARVENTAILAIERSGGTVWYDWRFVNGGVIGVEKPWWHRWADFAGFGSFARVRLVVLPHGTDADLVHLAGLDNLTALDLTGSPVTDAGLAHLSRSAQLVALELGGTAVSDAGLAILTGLPRLESLNLRKTRVTNSGLITLRDHPNINWLDLSGTDVGDVGVAHLAGLSRLRTLGLGKTRVTDAGLTQLHCLKNLTYLFLVKPKVSDSGLRELAGMSQLEDIFLNSTGVTDAGVADLQRALPKLRIGH